MHKNYIFDLGGILVDVNLNNIYSGLERLGFSAETQKEHMDHLTQWATDYEQGMVSTKDFFAHIQSFCQAGTSQEAVRQAWNSVIENTTQERLQLVKDLGAAHRVFLLSNTNEAHWEYIRQHTFINNGFPPEELFEQVFLSYEMKLIKPDVRIYQEVLRATGIQPGETLFIDDRADNLASAATLGIHTQCTPSLTPHDIY